MNIREAETVWPSFRRFVYEKQADVKVFIYFNAVGSRIEQATAGNVLTSGVTTFKLIRTL